MIKLSSQKLLGLLQFQSSEILKLLYRKPFFAAEKIWGSNKAHNLVLIDTKAV
jgi:hypothetical protein